MRLFLGLCFAWDSDYINIMVIKRFVLSHSEGLRPMKVILHFLLAVPAFLNLKLNRSLGTNDDLQANQEHLLPTDIYA